jgi:hypothetical protein
VDQPDFTEACSDGDRLGAAFKIEAPRSGGAQIVAVGQVVDEERLEGKIVLSGAIVAPSEGLLPGEQHAADAPLARRDGYTGESGLPFTGAGERFGSAVEGELPATPRAIFAFGNGKSARSKRLRSPRPVAVPPVPLGTVETGSV